MEPITNDDEGTVQMLCAEANTERDPVRRRNARSLCSAKSRCDLTQQFPRSNIHGEARREHLALVSSKWLATHADGSLGAAAACCRNPECLAPSSHEVVPDCSGQPTPA